MSPAQRSVSSPTLTMRDVARKAGVSVGTVSNVLNQLPSVSEENRARVLEAIDAIGYVRNESARQLKRGRSGTLGLVLLDASNPFFAEVAMGVEEVAGDAGYSVFTCNATGQSARELVYLSVLEEYRVDAIVLVCAELTDMLRSHLEAIEKRGTPIVVVGHSFEDHSFVSVTGDNREGGRLAGQHFLDCGYTTLTFLTGPLHLEGFALRLQGLREAFRASGHPSRSIEVVEIANTTIEAGAAKVRELLASHAPPRAIFCANDLLALGALQAAFTQDWHVPRDLAISGYDDISFAEGAAVPLTSIRQPSSELGRQAAHLAIESSDITLDERPQLVLEPELMHRASTPAQR